jgi:hypothetical protein
MLGWLRRLFREETKAAEEPVRPPVKLIPIRDGEGNLVGLMDQAVA